MLYEIFASSKLYMCIVSLDPFGYARSRDNEDELYAERPAYQATVPAGAHDAGVITLSFRPVDQNKV
jgi:hypothetical protein